jgi:hypothetical protein
LTAEGSGNISAWVERVSLGDATTISLESEFTRNIADSKDAFPAKTDGAGDLEEAGRDVDGGATIRMAINTKFIDEETD